MSHLKPLVVTLCGATCSGKSTLANLLQKTLQHSSKFHQDDYYHSEDYQYHIPVPELNHINWELETAFDNRALARGIENKLAELKEFQPKIVKSELVSAIQLLDAFPETRTELFTECQELLKTLSLPPVVILEGITTLNNSSLRQLSDLKIFIGLDHETCVQRRLLRSYDPPDPPNYFEKIVWPTYLLNKKDVIKNCSDDLLELNGSDSIEKNYLIILKSILKELSK